jgi:hypothetical protein
MQIFLDKFQNKLVLEYYFSIIYLDLSFILCIFDFPMI